MKKGFTLIELLAVIVILAIIAIIAIPQITNVVENAKKEAGARSVEGHVESVNTELAKKMLLGNDLSDGEYSLTSLDIKTKGNTTCVSYTIKSNTVISASSCTSNGYLYNYDMSTGASILGSSKSGVVTDIYAKSNGRLHVEGSKLMNSKNQEFRLIGASMGNSTLYAENRAEFSKKAFATLKSWGANIVRIWVDGCIPWKNAPAYYIGHEDEYLSYLYEAVDNAIENDLYVIIDWDSHGENRNPMPEKAKEAFEKITAHYPNNPYIMYEIWNETDNTHTWADIKAYALDVIPTIRKNSPDSIVVVGTPYFDRLINAPINDRVNFKNIMYTNHMYMNSMTEEYISALKEAIDANLPLFVTEWGAVDNSPIPEGDFINEAHAYSYLRLLNKYNLSHIFFVYHASKWAYGFTAPGNWSEELPVNTLKQSGLFFKKIAGKDYTTNKYLMAENSSDNGKYYRSSEWKDKIVSVSFETKIDIPKNAEVTWDLSATGDKTVMGYLVPSSESGMYDLKIAANGYVNLPINSKSLFNGLTNVKSYDLKNVLSDDVQNFSFTFRNNKALESIDLSNIDSSRITYIYRMFSDDSSLKSVNFTGWRPKITGLTYAFSGCSNLESIDISGFDVTNVTNFEGLFMNCSKLKNVNISTWNPNKISNMNYMFTNTSNMVTIDISKFSSITSSTSAVNTLKGVKANATVNVNNQTVIDLISPSANNTLNYKIKD